MNTFLFIEFYPDIFKFSIVFILLICSALISGFEVAFFSLSEKERKKLKSSNIADLSFSAYLKFDVLDKPGVLSNITNIFSKNKVSIKRLVQDPNKGKKLSSIIIITHSSKDRYLNKIVKQISKKTYIKKKPKLIRIDDN